MKRRADGWPLCPKCDEDELWSRLMWDGSGAKPPISDYEKAGLTCYKCQWTNIDAPAMKTPLGISELVARAGDVNIQVQNLLANTVDLSNTKKGATIKFMTDPAMVKAFMDASLFGGKSTHVGLVLWIPTEVIDRINKEHPIE